MLEGSASGCQRPAQHPGAPGGGVGAAARWVARRPEDGLGDVDGDVDVEGIEGEGMRWEEALGRVSDSGNLTKLTEQSLLRVISSRVARSGQTSPPGAHDQPCVVSSAPWGLVRVLRPAQAARACRATLSTRGPLRVQLRRRRGTVCEPSLHCTTQRWLCLRLAVRSG
ncbi:hypothetical protein VTN02DRAFT_1437 [Thermoascus thermophilus]